MIKTSPPPQKYGRLIGLLRWCLVGQIALFAVSLLAAPPLDKAHEASVVITDRDGGWLRALPVAGGTWRLRADLDRLDKGFTPKLLALEDARYYWHFGIDPLSIFRALQTNSARGEVVSGASTISMQTARLLWPKERTIGAKLIEMGHALILEARYSKRELLALYLTLTPYGGNIEGVRAASLAWFGHEPDTLLLEEAALLIALPQSPEQRRPDRQPKSALMARNLVLQRLLDKGKISDKAKFEAEQSQISAHKYPFAAKAWHLTQSLSRGATHATPTIRSTIDGYLQARLERLVSERRQSFDAHTSLSVLVVKTSTREVIAYIGTLSLDRFGGYVDMAKAYRSPGSALKPFVYGVGFENGLISPETRLSDLPTRFGDYMPENFDRAFHGQVKVREALIHSLNIPAVYVLDKIGPENFSSRIENSGIDLLRSKSHLKASGLALALGGEGLRPVDLVMLYCALGDKGQVKPLTYQLGAPKLPEFGRYLLSPSAAADVVEILQQTPAPKGFVPRHLTKSRAIAYKTGTSYGFRDALAAGLMGDYTALVWVGRPDGGARTDETGRDVAAPLLFEVFDQIDAPRMTFETRSRPVAPSQQTADRIATLDEKARLSVLFPPDKAVLFVSATDKKPDGTLLNVVPLKLSARGQGLVRWYLQGEEIMPDANGDRFFSPPTEGFYDLKAVDEHAQTKTVTVRVRAVLNQHATPKKPS